AQQEIKVKKGFGQLIEMRPIVANLGGAQSQRYIKLTPYLELANDKIKEDIEKNIVPIRNSFLMYISDLKVEEAVTADQKKKISEDMRKVINEIFGKKVVRRVFFSEFVMQ
ncbi:MAG: flagellar basal body-associated FliL family protein, partial [Polyangiales bacterium]